MSLQETLLSAILLAVITAAMAAHAAYWGDLARTERAAADVELVARAAAAHMALNRTSLRSRLEDGGVLTLSASDLQEAGALAAGASVTTPWGQAITAFLWRRQDEGRTGDADDGLSGLVAAVGPGDGERLALPSSHVPAAVARRLERGFWKPSARALAAMGAEDASTLAGPGGLRVPSTQFGIAADTLPAGSFGRFLDVAGSADGVDASDFLNRVGNGSSARPNTALNTMETDLDMGANRVAGVAALRFSPIAEGLLAFDGSIAASIDAFRQACAAGAAGDAEDGEDDGGGSSVSLEGMLVVDAESGLWRCGDGTVTALHDSRGAVLIKAVALVPFDTTIPVPTTCPPGSARTVYAIPTSTAVKETVTSDGSSAERANDALFYFGTAAQEVTGEDGETVYDFPAAIDLSCPDGDCPATDHNFHNLVIVACQYPDADEDADGGE